MRAFPEANKRAHKYFTQRRVQSSLCKQPTVLKFSSCLSPQSNKWRNITEKLVQCRRRVIIKFYFKLLIFKFRLKGFEPIILNPLDPFRIQIPLKLVMHIIKQRGTKQ